MRRPRRAGSRWRFLAWQVAPGSGDGRIELDSRTQPPSVFDEIVVDRWLHAEQMDRGSWWVNVGGVTLSVRVDRDGRPRDVAVYGPLDYDRRPRPGCTYHCAWTPLGEAA